MNLVNGDGSPMQTQEQNEQPLSTAECGEQLAHFMITKAGAYPTNESINKQFEILKFAALHILSHRIVNIGLGFGEEDNAKAIIEWDASRGFAAEKTIQEELTEHIQKWKDKFNNGELQYHPSKPS